MEFNLIQYKLAKKELEEVLSPEKRENNITLWAINSKSQIKFNQKLNEIGLEVIGNLDKGLIDAIKQTIEEIEVLKAQYNELSSNSSMVGKLDFDIAKIIHKNLNLSRINVINYGFWRWVNINYFIENVRWRWIKEPENINRIRQNAKAIFQRGFGERDKRIDILRYWFIGERLFDINKKYFYLEKLAEKAKEKNGPFQDYLNNIIDNDLLSPNDQLSKTMAQIMLIDSVFKTQNLIGAFKRYHAYTNRFLIEADNEIFKKEICLQ
jgi:hypothetical protein